MHFIFVMLTNHFELLNFSKLPMEMYITNNLANTNEFNMKQILDYGNKLKGFMKEK